MELTCKTTILFPPDLHDRLSGLAARRGISLGELVREACEREYGLASRTERLEAVEVLASLGLPIASVAQLKRESLPDDGPDPSAA